MSYAIRFEPLTVADGLDPARVCCAYLSRQSRPHGEARLTTVRSDLRAFDEEGEAYVAARMWTCIDRVVYRALIRRRPVRAVVVPLADALADLTAA